MKTQTAIFASGCFWGVEEAFRTLNGVVSTKVGYSGGDAKNSSYREVCTGRTGHAESVKIEFNPDEISYEDLLKKFWEIHDPTTLNRQGPDIGSQYRSIIFYADEKQKQAAEKSKQAEQKNYKNKIVTEIIPAKEFYDAEEYHQKYLMRRGVGSCNITL